MSRLGRMRFTLGISFLSVITILEIEAGSLMIARRDAAQGAILRAWIDNRVLTAFDGRILPVDTKVAQRCASLHVPDPRAERDALIAATALVHRLRIATRNVRDFAPMGVERGKPLGIRTEIEAQSRRHRG